MQRGYVILDIETTGLSRHSHRITEIAALKVENFQVVKKFETLINPETSIPSFITSLTGISNSMVKDSPVIEEVMPKFMKFIGENPFIAHSASFDYGFLNYNAQMHLEREIINPKICTMKLSRRLIPQLRSHKLSSLCQYFKIENASAHRAMGDVEATNKLFNNLLNIMKEQGIEKREDVVKFQDSKVRRF
jgi:DNA polymerase-3 subunit alpha (Gram-positive type)